MLGTFGEAGGTPVTLAVPVYGGEPQRLCHNYCPADGSSTAEIFCWKCPDGHALVFSLAPGKTLHQRIRAWQMLPHGRRSRA